MIVSIASARLYGRHAHLGPLAAALLSSSGLPHKQNTRRTSYKNAEGKLLCIVPTKFYLHCLALDRRPSAESY